MQEHKMAGTDTGIKYAKRKIKELAGSSLSEAGRITDKEASQAEGPRGRARLSNDLFADPKDIKASDDLRKNIVEITRENLGVQNRAKGGKVSSASKRSDGIAQRGKTKGRMC
jgi:hypothetical protein